jgi:hypothetical protein
VIATIEGIKPLAEIEVVETIVAQTYEGDLGGGMPPVVISVEGV